MNELLIFMGGGLGAVSRFWVASMVGRQMGPAFPWGTLSVNLIGAFAIALLSEFLALKFSASPALRLFLIVGFLGGFTTFSAFSLESSLMLARGDYLTLVAYCLASVIGTITVIIFTQHFVRFFL